MAPFCAEPGSKGEKEKAEMLVEVRRQLAEEEYERVMA
jgi:hypothetical protein